MPFTLEDLFQEIEDEDDTETQEVVAELDGVKVPVKGVRFDRNDNQVVIELSQEG